MFRLNGNDNAPVLSFERVRRGFVVGTPVLEDVTFAVGREELVALVGRNAAGKTTLLTLAMGLLRPERGTVRTFGVDPTQQPVAVKRRIGYVGETTLFPTTSTVSGVLDLHRRLYPTWDVALERELLTRFELAGRGGRILALSNGQRQQLSLLCAVCHRPELLVLDEPAAALDPSARREFLETSLQLLNREGTTVLFSSHNMTDVERIGGRVLLLHDGIVALDEPLDTLREKYGLAVVPTALVPDPSRLQAIPGLCSVRQKDGTWRVVIAGDATESAARIAAALGTPAVQFARLSLEDLFIEVTNADRLSAIA